MADRVFSYQFRGNFSDLKSGLSAAGRNVEDFKGKLTATDKEGAKMRASLTQVGDTAGKVGLAAAAGVGVIVAANMRFEKSVSAMSAATGAAGEELESLRAAALQAGQDTAFSATEAADAVTELAKAGVSSADILGGALTGSLDLAAAGGLDVAEAAGIAATTMQQFKLEGSDAAHVADLLAAGAGKAMGDVGDLSQALNQSGLIAAQMGLSVEETTGALAAFASAGLLGSDAGTAMKTALLALANPSKESAETMAALGISAYDAAGNFVGLESLAGQLQTAFAGQTQAQRDAAMATIFGSDAIRVAAILYDQGAEGIGSWTDKVNDAGFAADQAAKLTDNLAGDLEELGGSLETALIGAGDGANGMLRELTQNATAAVNVFNNLPGPVQSATTGLLALTAVTGGSLWFGSKVVTGVANTRAALADLGIQAGSTRTALMGVAKSAGLIGATVAAIDWGTDIFDSIQRSLEAGDQAAQTVSELEKRLQDSNVGKYAADLGIDVQRLAADLGAAGTEGEYYAQVLEQLDGVAEGFGGALNRLSDFVGPWIGDTEQAGLANLDLGKIVRGNADLLGNMAAETDGSATATEGLTNALGESVPTLNAQTGALEKNTRSLRDRTDAALSAFDAETRWRQALMDAAEQAKKNQAGIQGNTEAAQNNRQALSDLASAWNDQSKAVRHNEERQKAARSTFIETAEAMGVPEKAARDLADRLLAIPEKRETKVDVRTDDALNEVDRIRAELRAIPDETVNVWVTRRAVGASPGMGPVDDFPMPRRAAAGGHVPTDRPAALPAALTTGA